MMNEFSFGQNEDLITYLRNRKSTFKLKDDTVIKELKRAAEWMGEEVEVYNEDNSYIKNSYHDSELQVKVRFNPHQETGRYWLVEMERKLTGPQAEKYIQLLSIEFKKAITFTLPECVRFIWIKTAPTELCFEKIMEVIC